MLGVNDEFDACKVSVKGDVRRHVVTVMSINEASLRGDVATAYCGLLNCSHM